MNRQVILKHQEIQLILERLAVQVAESNLDSNQLVLMGLNERGYFISKIIFDFLKKYLPQVNIELQSLSISPEGEIVTSVTDCNKEQSVIIIDDVLNSGRTAFKAATYCFSQGVKKIETLFLAQREHRNFPIHANFVGVSIATTLRDHVYFDNTDSSELQVYLT